MPGMEHSAEPVEEVDYRCDWCATAIYTGDEAYNIAAFSMGIGHRTGNLCLEEDYFADGDTRCSSTSGASAPQLVLVCLITHLS